MDVRTGRHIEDLKLVVEVDTLLGLVPSLLLFGGDHVDLHAS